MVAPLVIRLGLHQYLEPQDIRTMGRSLFLFMDQSEFFDVLSENKAGGRTEDISTTELQELITLVEFQIILNLREKYLNLRETYLNHVPHLPNPWPY